MALRVTANIDDEPTAVHVEDCEDMDEAKDLVKKITEDGFFYEQDKDECIYYSPWMINSVHISKVKNVRN